MDQEIGCIWHIPQTTPLTMPNFTLKIVSELVATTSSGRAGVNGMNDYYKDY